MSNSDLGYFIWMLLIVGIPLYYFFRRKAYANRRLKYLAKYNSQQRIETLEKTIKELEQKIEKLERQNATQSKQTPGTLERPTQRRNRPGSG